MSWLPADDPVLGDKRSCDALELVVVARSHDRGVTWEAPIRPREDGWVYPGCPHAGPSLKVGSDGVVHIAWWTGKEGEAGVYYAHSGDRGMNFSAEPIAVGETSTPAHVQLALSDSSVAVVWDDGLSELPGILLRVSPDGGGRFGPTTRVSAPGSAASFPVIGAWGDSLLVAWTQVGEATHRAELASKRSHNGGSTPLPRVGQSEILVRVGSFR